MKKTNTKDRLRASELAKIHIAKKDLGLDEDTYRAMLYGITGVESAAKLTAKGRQKILAHLRAMGWRGRRGITSYPDRPLNMEHQYRGRLLHKIEALLAEAKRPWSYADVMAKRMFGTEKIQWCRPPELHKIVAALMYDARRHGRYTGEK